MNVGKVIGTVVASRKDPKLEGLKLLLVQSTDLSGQAKGSQVVAVDAVGAGIGEIVLYCAGSSARQTDITQNRPVDHVIMAIVDEIESGGKTTFRK
ncbi:MAG: ethanolamine utilization protein EutN [Bdellovibrionales bacterium RIFOXYD1_FULL_44_7]|nr:MAG: ethanolamine utilization protein EutN [Bdellovibrionales bacterium RIFOXYD1_FULL_44_7]